MARHSKANAIIKRQLVDKMSRAAENAISAILEKKGFTGNLATGTVACVMDNGRIVYTADTESHLPAPVRRKVTKSEGWAYLRTPYSGASRSVRATVDTNGGYGHGSALSTVKSAPKKKCLTLRIANGAEYMEYVDDDYKTLHDIIPLTRSFF